MKTKDKILQVSIDLFNHSGVVAITTNHIAKELDISPGNLYFHYENKEDIIRNLFKMMCDETYALWQGPRNSEPIRPIEVVQRNFDLYWRFRFFHREMYYMRRKDPELAKMWKNHMSKMLKIMRIMYRRWTRIGWMRRFESGAEMDFVAHALLATASNYLQVFESSERRPSMRHVDSGVRFVIKLLNPYATDLMKEEFALFLNSPEAISAGHPTVDIDTKPDETSAPYIHDAEETEILPKSSLKD